MREGKAFIKSEEVVLPRIKRSTKPGERQIKQMQLDHFSEYITIYLWNCVFPDSSHRDSI